MATRTATAGGQHSQHRQRHKHGTQGGGLGGAGHFGTQRGVLHALRQGAGLVHAGAVGRGVIAHHLVHGDEAGVLREQVVLKTQLGNGPAEGVASLQRLLVAQGRNAVACPQVTQGGRIGARACADLHAQLKGSVGRLAFQHQLALGLAAPFAEHDDRALGQQVGQIARLHVVDIHPFKAQLHVGQHRCINHLAKTGGLGNSLGGLGDDEGLTHAGAGQPFHQVAVHTGTNTEREHIGLGQVGAHQLKGLAFHGHIAVGHHHHAARHVGRLGLGVDTSERRNQLGAAATARLVDGANRLFDVGPAGWHRVRVQKAVAAGEQQHIEGVAGAQTTNQLTQQGFGRVQRKAAHGA